MCAQDPIAHQLDLPYTTRVQPCVCLRSQRVHNAHAARLPAAVTEQSTASSIRTQLCFSGGNSVRLHEGVPYGHAPRNLLDIYTPPNHHRNKESHCNSLGTSQSLASVARAQDQGVGEQSGVPVVLYVHGGVWASGERWHYSKLANHLAQQGLVVCVMAYTLYPDAPVDTMVRSWYISV